MRLEDKKEMKILIVDDEHASRKKAQKIIDTLGECEGVEGRTAELMRSCGLWVLCCHKEKASHKSPGLRLVYET